MIELAIQVFEISVQVIFPTPRTFMKDGVDSDAQWLTDSASGFAIPPDQVGQMLRPLSPDDDLLGEMLDEAWS